MTIPEVHKEVIKMEYKPKYLRRKWEDKEDLLKKIEVPLHRILIVAIPINLDILSKHKSNIEKFKLNENWEKVHIEQVNASHTVKQLSALLNELASLQCLISTPEEIEAYERRTSDIKLQAKEEVDSFLETHSEVSSPLYLAHQEVENQKPSLYDDDELDVASANQRVQLMAEKDALEKIEEENHRLSTVYLSWNKLKGELQEVSNVMHRFAQYVRQQDEPISNIQDHISTTQENVVEGTNQLHKALLLKASMFPVTGAILGGIMGGPLGLMMGYKVAAAAGLFGGSTLGYFSGKYYQSQRVGHLGLEMKELKSSNSFASTSSGDDSERKTN